MKQNYLLNCTIERVDDYNGMVYLQLDNGQILGMHNLLVKKLVDGVVTDVKDITELGFAPVVNTGGVAPSVSNDPNELVGVTIDNTGHVVDPEPIEPPPMEEKAIDIPSKVEDIKKEDPVTIIKADINKEDK